MFPKICAALFTKYFMNFLVKKMCFHEMQVRNVLGKHHEREQEADMEMCVFELFLLVMEVSLLFLELITIECRMCKPTRNNTLFFLHMEKYGIFKGKFTISCHFFYNSYDLSNITGVIITIYMYQYLFYSQ